jgi:hypothetical protein
MATVIICKLEDVQRVLNEYQSQYSNRNDRLIAVHSHQGTDPAEVADFEQRHKEGRFIGGLISPLPPTIIYEWRELYFERV